VNDNKIVLFFHSFREVMIQMPSSSFAITAISLSILIPATCLGIKWLLNGIAPLLKDYFDYKAKEKIKKS